MAFSLDVSILPKASYPYISTENNLFCLNQSSATTEGPRIPRFCITHDIRNIIDDTVVMTMVVCL